MLGMCSLNVSHLLQACGVILNLLRQHDNHAEVRPLVRKLQDLEKKNMWGRNQFFGSETKAIEFELCTRALKHLNACKRRPKNPMLKNMEVTCKFRSGWKARGNLVFCRIIFTCLESFLWQRETQGFSAFCRYRYLPPGYLCGGCEMTFSQPLHTSGLSSEISLIVLSFLKKKKIVLNFARV